MVTGDDAVRAVPRPLLDDWDDLPDGAVVVDADTVVRVVNQAAERLLGLPAADLVGGDAAKVLPFITTDGTRWWECTDPWGGLATRTGTPERLLLLPADHTPRELLVSSRFRRDARGGPVERVVLSLRDARTRQRTQQAQGLLISTVAHELRSPLTSVKGFSSTLLRRWDKFTDEQKRFMLQTIELDADRVTRLISELLDISRLDAGRMQLRRQPVDLESAARRHFERMVASGYDGARFVLDVDRELPEVWADPDRVDQVLSNLLENAVRHGAGTVTLSISGRARGPAVAVQVSDEGDGIADEDLARVFTRFWHGSRRGGTGLGLYLVRGLVEAHGGTVHVGRGSSGGAEFRFTLPAGAPEHVA